jgi:surface polysaccharide O-acyltransferase-like enzyme
LNFAKYFGDFRISISAPLTNGFVGFFILGYLLGPWRLSRSTAIFTAAAWILSTLVTILGTYFLTRVSGKFENYFYGFTTPNVIIASATGFLLLKWISETWDFASPKTHHFIRLLAATSFGIYLLHVLVIEVLAGWLPGLHVDSFMGHPAWSIPLVCILVFFTSFLIVLVLQKVPVLNRIVP